MTNRKGDNMGKQTGKPGHITKNMKKRALNNFRAFFNALCALPLRERIKKAGRIIFKRGV